LDADLTFQLGGCRRPALCLAVERGHSKLVRLLLARNCSTALADRGGLSPLHLAASYGFVNVAEILLDNRADINMAANGGHGDTPLHLAVSCGQPAVAELLVSRSADVNRPNAEGRTVLMVAAARGHSGLVRLLVSAGADVTAVDRAGNTALLLHAASPTSNLVPEIVSLLLAPGVVNRGNSLGCYPILEVLRSAGAAPVTNASEEKHINVLKLLIAAGADLDMQNSCGSTPLLLACANCDWAAARILVRAGATTDLTDGLGRSALYLSLEQANFQLAEVILAAGGAERRGEQLTGRQLDLLGPAVRGWLVSRGRAARSLRYTARLALRRIWGRAVDRRLDEVTMPLSLKKYVYYLYESES
jgi:ankyrin repeat protein